MFIRQQKQLSPVADDVLALTAVVRPILLGVLYALKQEIVAEVGGYEGVKLKMLPRLYAKGDGDCGICFEYAVHHAMNTGDQRVIERIVDAAKLCNMKMGNAKPQSILFGVEKSGSQKLIDTAETLLTEDARLLYGTKGQPAKLRKHLRTIAGAFRNRNTRLALPFSIRGLWKTDLFVGYSDQERWLATTVKSRADALEHAAGLRIGIVPSKQGKTDKVRLDTTKNLVICPLHHDGDFMQTFYEGFRIVQAFIASRAEMPSEEMLPGPAEREVARILIQRREFPVVKVVEAIAVFAQPSLIETEDRTVSAQVLSSDGATETLVAPLPISS